MHEIEFWRQPLASSPDEVSIFRFDVDFAKYKFWKCCKIMCLSITLSRPLHHLTSVEPFVTKQDLRLPETLLNTNVVHPIDLHQWML